MPSPAGSLAQAVHRALCSSGKYDTARHRMEHDAVLPANLTTGVLHSIADRMVWKRKNMHQTTWHQLHC